MKILFFISDYNYGLTSLLTGQAIAFDKIKNHKLTFITGNTEKEEGLFKKLKEAKIDYVIVNHLEYHINFMQQVKDVLKVVLENKPNIIHVQTNWQLAICTYLKYRYSIKFDIFYTLHGFQNHKKIKSVFARFFIGLSLLLFVKKVIVCSNYTKKKFRILSYKIKVLYLGVDELIFNKVENDVLKSNTSLKVIFPAEFRVGKNQDLLLYSLAKYIKEFPLVDVQLILPGNGANFEKCVSLAKKLGIENKVFFPGYLSKHEIIRLYNECSIAIIPSNSETFGLCIAEPYSLGRCIISRNVGVAPDIIKNGINGFLFTKDNDFYPLFSQVLNNKASIDSCGNVAFLDRMIFNWSEISNEYTELLNSFNKQ
jgi:glycosyltransferase involved in cell wall biosynthesis